VTRPAVESDIERVARIWFDGWHDAHAAIVPEALTRLRTLDSFRDRTRAHLADTVVAVVGGKVAGFAMLREDEVYQFYIDASARGTGAAQALMAEAEAQLASRGVGTAWLACAIGNDRAARFYDKCGWRRTATVVNNADTPDGPFPLQVWRYERTLR
jgi:ribosomal protein S18 acetylase RimI-like enzyme